MLLSRLIWVQPSGPVIDSLAERRAVTTPIRTSPSIPPGWATVSDDALEVRAVELPLTAIDPPSFPGGTNPFSSITNTRPAAGAADATNSATATRAMRAAGASSRGRLPNMPGPSAAGLERPRQIHSCECHSKQAFPSAQTRETPYEKGRSAGVS
jgi:hypothetical protein